MAPFNLQKSYRFTKLFSRLFFQNGGEKKLIKFVCFVLLYFVCMLPWRKRKLINFKWYKNVISKYERICPSFLRILKIGICTYEKCLSIFKRIFVFSGNIFIVQQQLKTIRPANLWELSYQLSYQKDYF